jgi:hypothetical protein
MRYLLYFTFLILAGCSKEQFGHTKTFYVNSTNHSIKLLPYNGGLLLAGDVKTIPPLSTTEAYSASVRGKTIDPCFGTLLQPYDSVLVTYDDAVKIPHIKFNLSYTGTHRVLFTSNRSISNPGNYIREITNETKFSIEGRFTYTFTEQDYLEAR